MRKRRWVLYQNKASREFYIVEDSTSTILSLEKLEHCLGVFSSQDSAFDYALARLNAIIDRARKNIIQLTRD